MLAAVAGRLDFINPPQRETFYRMEADERNELVDLVAQAVIDRIEQREQVNNLADMVVARVIALQKEEAALQQAQENAAPQT